MRKITRENKVKVTMTTPMVTMMSTKEKYNKEQNTIPYMQGLGESIKNIYKRYGIQTHFKGNRTIKNLLVKSKDKDPLDKKSGAYLSIPIWGAHVQ